MIQSIRALFVLTILFGGIYPAATWIVGKVVFNDKINGSLIQKENEVKGSLLISQKVEADKWFRARPSASDYGTVASGASQWGYSNKKFKEQVQSLSKSMSLAISRNNDAVTNSASGLDPHISIAYAKNQVPNIAKARQMTEDTLYKIIDNLVEKPTLGIMGQERVNVNALNSSL